LAATSTTAAVITVPTVGTSARAADADDDKNPEADQIPNDAVIRRHRRDSSSAYFNGPLFAGFKFGQLPQLGFGAENQVNLNQPTLVEAAPNMMLAQLGAHVISQVSQLFWGQPSVSASSDELQPTDCQEPIDSETFENSCSFMKLLLLNLKSSSDSKALDDFLQVIDVAPSQQQLASLINEVQSFVDTLDQSDPAVRYATSSLKRIQTV